MQKSYNALPYHLEGNLQAQAFQLAEILKLPKTLLGRNPGDKEVSAMASVIMYRHLDRIDQHKAMENIYGLGNPKLTQSLVGLIIDAKVNPQWGIWSLTTEELLSDQRFHSMVDSYAGFIGLTASGLGILDQFKKVVKSKKMTKGGLAMVAIWGAFYFNHTELDKSNEEIARRSSIKSSELYR